MRTYREAVKAWNAVQCACPDPRPAECVQFRSPASDMDDFGEAARWMELEWMDETCDCHCHEVWRGDDEEE